MSSRCWRALVPGVALMSPLVAWGQCPEQWFPGGWRIGQPGEVRFVTTWDPDGAGPLPEVLVAGGDFHLAGGQPVDNIAAWDGQSWSPLGQGLANPVTGLVAYNGTLFASTSDVNFNLVQIHRFQGGSWVLDPHHGGTVQGIVAGELLSPDYPNLWSWNGTQWRSIQAGNCFGAFGEYRGALVSAAFMFYTPCVALFDGSSWLNISGGLTGVPQFGEALAVLEHGGDLYLAGSFYSQGTYGIGRWDGTAWNPVGSSAAHYVRALQIHNSDLIAAGSVSTPGTVASVARWSGQEWVPLAVPLTARQAVQALCTFRGELIAAGQFTELQGTPMGSVARFDGALWHALGEGVDLGGEAGISAVHTSGPDLYIGGWFGSLRGLRCGSVAHWDGGAWHNMAGGVSGSNSAVIESMCPFGGRLVVGGQFDSAGGVPALNIAAWSGSEWAPLGAGLGRTIASYVWALAEYQGQLYAGGRQLGPAGSSNLWRWDGAVWTEVPTQSPDDINALAVYNGELYVGGSGINVPGGGRGLGRWTGSLWLPVGTAGQHIYARELTVYNNELIIGTSSANFPSGITRWNGQSFGPMGLGGSGLLTGLAVGGGELLVVGGLQSAGGMPANHAALWNGSRWRALGQGLETAWGYNAGPRAAAAYQGGFVVGGNFTHAGGELSPGLARWGRGVPECYANCDCSAVAPALNVNDFVCFLNRFTAGDEYANCDGSTTAPVLNVGDFICFQNRFAAGCP